MRPNAPRMLLAAGLVACAMGVLPASADAAHHQVRINEVFPGNATFADAEYVELKLAAAGEHLVNGTSIRFYAANGTEGTPAMFIANEANGENQRTILIGTPSAETNIPTPQVDLEYPNADRMDPAGGAVCFDSPSFAGVDCVSWGSFPPATVLPDATGSTPHGTPEPGPISAGSSLQRFMDPNCPTLLELGDDTNDSATDFSYVDPQTPRNNDDAAEGAACTTLNVIRTGSSGASSSVSGNGSPPISCPPTCFSYFTPGQTAMLVATPDLSSTFTGWTNCPSPSGDSCSALMDMSRTISANFEGPTPCCSDVTPIPPVPPPVLLHPPLQPPKKCRKGQKLRKGKCVRKRKKK